MHSSNVFENNVYKRNILEERMRSSNVENNDVWFYKRNKESPALGPFGTGQMLVWSRAGVICDVIVSREKEGVYSEISDTREFKNELGTPPPPKLTRWQKAKALWKEHGLVFVMYYGTLWIVPFVPMFGMLQSGQIDCVELLETFHVDRIVDLNMLNSTAINIIVATECNEVLDFVRLPFVVATTPYVSRWLRREKNLSEK